LVGINIVSNHQKHVSGVVAQTGRIHMVSMKDGFGELFPILKNRFYFSANKRR